MAKVRKHHSGTWFVDYTVRIGKTARRNRAYGFETKAEAEAFKTQLILRPLDQVIDYQQIIIKSLEESILEYQTNATAKKASAPSEIVYFKKLTDYLSTRADFDGTVSCINPLMIVGLQTWLLDSTYTRANKYSNPEKARRRPMSPSTVNRYFNTYRNFFEKCRQWNFIRKNPCEFLEDLPIETKEKRTWPIQACREVLSDLPEWAQRTLIAIAATGARRGEICRLLIEKVDLETRHVVLRSKKGKGRIVERPVPMTDGFHRFMTEQVELCRKQKWPYVFVGPEGKEISMAYLTKIVTNKARKRGYKGLTIHGLRHTLLSVLANSGTGLNAVRQLAGHSNLRTTQGYLHTDTTHIANALNQNQYVEELQKSMAPKGHKEKGTES